MTTIEDRTNESAGMDPYLAIPARRCDEPTNHPIVWAYASRREEWVLWQRTSLVIVLAPSIDENSPWRWRCEEEETVLCERLRNVFSGSDEMATRMRKSIEGFLRVRNATIDAATAEKKK